MKPFRAIIVLSMAILTGPCFGQHHDDVPIAYTIPTVFADADASLSELLALEVENAEDAASVFQNRLLPILKSGSSSCADCHSSGVHLANYILPDQSETFAALKRDGLIDVDDPDHSKLLQFIARRPETTNELSERTRVAEFKAVRAWIHAAVNDPAILAAKTDAKIGTELSPEVIRHMRRDRVLASFVDNIWNQMGRCVSCHSPDRNERLVKKHGDQVSWIVPHDPEATLQILVDSGNIDLDDPANSPVLTKPIGLEEHGGGPKFMKGGETHRRFIAFLTDYAAIQNGDYRNGDSLPRQSEVMLLTRQFLRLTDMPESLAMVPLYAELFPVEPGTDGFSKQRVGLAFGPIAGKRHLWNGQIQLTVPVDSPRADEFRRKPLLPGGPMLVKFYLDREKKTQTDFNYEFTEDDFVGQLVVRGNWPIGFKTPKIMHAPKDLAEVVAE